MSSRMGPVETTADGGSDIGCPTRDSTRTWSNEILGDRPQLLTGELERRRVGKATLRCRTLDPSRRPHNLDCSVAYRDLGADWFLRRHDPERHPHRLAHQIGSLAFNVTTTVGDRLSVTCETFGLDAGMAGRCPHPVPPAFARTPRFLALDDLGLALASGTRRDSMGSECGLGRLKIGSTTADVSAIHWFAASRLPRRGQSRHPAVGSG
jgi:hypothetical protein